MNRQESDILKSLLYEPFINQRILSEATGHSLGVVNKALKHLTETGLLNKNMSLTAKARDAIAQKNLKTLSYLPLDLECE